MPSRLANSFWPPGFSALLICGVAFGDGNTRGEATPLEKGADVPTKSGALTGVDPHTNTSTVFVCGSTPVSAPDFVGTSAPFSRGVASPRVLPSPKATPHISNAENPGGQNEFASLEGI